MTPPDVTPFVSRLADRAVSVVCPPKLNLMLAVGRPRADGLHPIASLMVGLGPGFADTLAIESLDEGPSAFEISFAPDAPNPGDVDWPITSDLTYRAHALLEKEAGRALPVRCVLSKRIPAGAGLGGGSSDAAGMLVGLRELFDLPISDQRLVALGGALGSDVGFCVHVLLGRPVAWVAGVGEQITPLAIEPTFHAVLLLCDAKCPTAEVYRRFDQLNVGRFREQLPSQSAVRSKALTDVSPYNDLAAAALDYAPAMRVVQEHAKSLGATAEVSGSGSALFVVCPDQITADRLRERLELRDVTAVTVSTFF